MQLQSAGEWHFVSCIEVVQVSRLHCMENQMKTVHVIYIIQACMQRRTN